MQRAMLLFSCHISPSVFDLIFSDLNGPVCSTTVRRENIILNKSNYLRFSSVRQKNRWLIFHGNHSPFWTKVISGTKSASFIFSQKKWLFHRIRPAPINFQTEFIASFRIRFSCIQSILHFYLQWNVRDIWKLNNYINRSINQWPFLLAGRQIE